MTDVVFRTDDGTRWGTGLGHNLTETDFDLMNWEFLQRIIALEGEVAATGVGISNITQPAPDQILFTMTDSTTRGPFTIPVGFWNPRGAWAPSTVYLKLDVFTENGALYVVLLALTSALTFDPAANDGMGHDFYGLVVPAPPGVLPTGGATGQVVEKASTTDYAVTWGWKSPIGGTIHQLPIKQSSTQDDWAWGFANAINVTFSPSTASGLVSTNVASALEEIEALIGTDLTGYLPLAGGTLTGVLTLTLAPVFTDAAGTRTALGLGTAATHPAIDFQTADPQLSSLIRQNSQSANYTTVLSDGGKHIFHPDTDTTARTFTIDSNANVAYPIGTAITFVNGHGAGVVTIAITADTMRLSPDGTTGSRALAADGIATSLKIGTTEWKISGTGLT
jgi:hypothetical protein